MVDPDRPSALSVRGRRLRSERELLWRLIDLNPETLAFSGAEQSADAVRVSLRRTCGITSLGPPCALSHEHDVRLLFPRFYPAMPTEAYLTDPIFHPNVDPRNGFVCLWTRTSSGDTVIEALCRLQRIIAWELVNLDAAHVVQAAAADWYVEPNLRLPLDYTPLVVPHEFYLERSYAQLKHDRPRRRLDEP
ncbi:MAG: ubiquitin-conjugating enzyme E2 [Acidobacteriota bacterium]